MGKRNPTLSLSWCRIWMIVSSRGSVNCVCKQTILRSFKAGVMKMTITQGTRVEAIVIIRRYRSKMFHKDYCPYILENSTIRGITAREKQSRRTNARLVTVLVRYKSGHEKGAEIKEFIRDGIRAFLPREATVLRQSIVSASSPLYSRWIPLPVLAQDKI